MRGSWFGKAGPMSSVFRKRSFLSVWPNWGWQHHPRRRREIIYPVMPCLRFARVVIAANAIAGLLADNAHFSHKWPPPGVIKHQTQEGKLTVSHNLGTGTVPPSRV